MMPSEGGRGQMKWSIHSEAGLVGSLETAKTNKEKQLLQTYFLLMKGDDI